MWNGLLQQDMIDAAVEERRGMISIKEFQQLLLFVMETGLRD
jgi:hypothetical protein